jgi:hypothetical protein
MISTAAPLIDPARPGPTIVVLQPGYFPWLGFFDQMRRADVFVYYDDVQFDKHGWRNRNRIKSADGPGWLTVPVRHSGLGKPQINEIEIDARTPWPRKHVGTIRQCYGGAPYLGRYLPELTELLMRPWGLLVDLDLAVAALLANWLGLRPRIERASALGIGGTKTGRLVAICRHFGAARYLSGNAAQTYLDVDEFVREGIDVEWQNFQHPVYPQQHGDFVPGLSALDLLLNCGDDSRFRLAGDNA